MAKAKMQLKVVTPERILHEGEAEELVIETKSGQITVFPNHQAMVTILKAGEALIRNEGKEEPLVLSGGLLEVARNQVVVLADTAEHINELDLERAKKAMELAKKLITEQKFEPHEYEALQANLAKHQARVSAFTKWRK
jgi:F-type H+-transporting ATPase subunit epsilon